MYVIRVDAEAVPVVHPSRKVSFAMREKLRNELIRLKELNVIAKVNEPTSWVNSLVVVNKKNGNLRLCLDPRNLNRAILREHFNLPTREELTS